MSNVFLKPRHTMPITHGRITSCVARNWKRTQSVACNTRTLEPLPRFLQPMGKMPHGDALGVRSVLKRRVNGKAEVSDTRKARHAAGVKGQSHPIPALFCTISHPERMFAAKLKSTLGSLIRSRNIIKIYACLQES